MGDARKSLAILFLVTCIFLFTPRTTYSCGPTFPSTFFSYSNHPDFPYELFAGGRLGILRPTYPASYLFVAYRYLAGKVLYQEEQQAMVALWKERQNPRSVSAYDGAQKWLEIRRKVPGAKEISWLDIYRNEKQDNQGYVWYLNCRDDAFVTAKRTLEERIAKFGSESPEVKDWLQAQDMVFTNCSKGKTIPPPTARDTNPLIRADRAYQIAAAYFYSGDFDTARNLFKEISNDSTSPWKEIAPYVAARALIRKDSINRETRKGDKGFLVQAETELRKIIEDKNLSKIHAASEELLDFVRLWMDPNGRMRTLAEAVLEEKSGNVLKSKLTDYLYLRDRVRVEKPDDLTDWICNFKTGPSEYSVKKWKETRSLPWLVSSLSKMKADQPELAALLDEGGKVKPDSPAYPTITYHIIRLLSDSGKKHEARKRLDKLFLEKKILLTPSSVNLFLAQRMGLALNLNEFLTYGKRIPVGIFYDYDSRQIPDEYGSIEKLKPFEGLEFFDTDAVNVFNGKLPLSIMAEAVKSNILPEHLRRQLAVSAWVRAVLLDKEMAARELARLLRRLIPELKDDIAFYQVEKAEEDIRFSGLFLILRNPGMQPYLKSGIGRFIALNKIDDFRDNWWCSLKQDNKPYSPSRFPPEIGRAFPDFLSEAQKKEAEEEWNGLWKIAAAPNYLSERVIARVKSKPEDSRIPEALYLAVRSTRYGCVDKETTKFSKEAYTILHKQYPESPWTNKTPYWF